MQVLKLLKNYIIESQIFVSAMGTLLAVFFMMEQQTLHLPTIALIFLTFWNGYLYTKFQHSKLFHKILIFSILNGILALMIIYLNPEISFLKWSVIVLLGLLYNSKFLENAVRKIPLLKIFYVGFTWAIVCSWLTLSNFSIPIFLISWLFVTALVLPFDIRDMHDDQVVTFPKAIGIQNTKYFAYALIFTALIISIFYLKSEFGLSFFIASIISFILIYFSEPTNRDSYFSFWVELCTGLPFLFMVLLQYF